MSTYVRLYPLTSRFQPSIPSALTPNKSSTALLNYPKPSIWQTISTLQHIYYLIYNHLFLSTVAQRDQYFSGVQQPHNCRIGQWLLGSLYINCSLETWLVRQSNKNWMEKKRKKYLAFLWILSMFFIIVDIKWWGKEISRQTEKKRHKYLAFFWILTMFFIIVCINWWRKRLSLRKMWRTHNFIIIIYSFITFWTQDNSAKKYI